MELNRIVERLNSLKKTILLNTGRDGGDGNKSWVDRAMDEHISRPFAAIIACQNGPGHPDVLVASQLDESNLVFAASAQRSINRTALEIVDCVGLLVDSAKAVKLVDPHFNPREPRYRRMLELILTRLGMNRHEEVILEIHRRCNADDTILQSNLKSFFNSHIPGIQTHKVVVQVYIHPENDMHNRFILTDLGGVTYNTGLDDNEAGGSAPTDVVTLLTPEIFTEEWATYSGQKPFLEYPLS